MAKLQDREVRMMIDLVVWSLYINVTDTQTATLPCKCCPNALRRAAKTVVSNFKHWTSIHCNYYGPVYG